MTQYKIERRCLGIYALLYKDNGSTVWELLKYYPTMKKARLALESLK